MGSQTINRDFLISTQNRAESAILSVSRQQAVVLGFVLVISILLSILVLSGTGSGYI